MLNEKYMPIWQKGMIYLVLSVVAVLMIAPFVLMLSTSLKTREEMNAVPMIWIPEQPRWQNYADVWNAAPMVNYLFNSTFTTLAITFGTLVTSALGAYAFARLKWLGRDKIFLLYIGTMMVPFAIVMIPFYQLIKTFGWVDSYEALIIPWMFSPYGTFLLRQFFLSIPQELEDSMIVEGASRLRILLQLFVPLTTPAFVTLGVFTALSSWNSFIWPLIVTSSQEKFVLPIGLNILAGTNTVNQPLVMAAVTVTVIPTIALFLFAQRWFVQSIATTGLR
jgi:multiple sugar transport system permease protein